MPPRMRSKYGNQRTKVDGRSFHSKVEAQRYCELRERQAKGVIQGLKCQPRFPMRVNGVDICTYIADFSYDLGGEFVVEDVKGGIITNDFSMKRKLLKALHGIDLVITTKKSHNRTQRWFWNGVMEEKMFLREISNTPA
jgi:hypothetical protein